MAGTSSWATFLRVLLLQAGQDWTPVGRHSASALHAGLWLVASSAAAARHVHWPVARARVIEAGVATSPLLRLWPLQVLHNVIISLPAKD